MKPHRLLFVHELVFLNRSTYGAGICAATALNALISVDYELCILLGNAVDGALGLASTALNALIGNFISHNYTSIVLSYIHSITLCRKIKREMDIFLKIVQK